MKSTGAIKHKINQIRYRHLKKRLSRDLRCTSGNCAHNLTVGEAEDGPAICGLGRQDPTWRPTFCDARLDNGARAQGCPHFKLKVDKHQVKSDFVQELQEMSLAEIAYLYPDLAALLWVLEDPNLDHSEEGVESPQSDPTPLASMVIMDDDTEQVPMPWWVRLVRWFR